MPRTGFERDKRMRPGHQLWQLSIKPTTKSIAEDTRQRFAYYVSLNGNRSNYGLQTPIPQVVHDAENGYGGFASFIFNPDPKNQFRVVASLREDYYQIPIDPDPNSVGNRHIPATASAMASTSATATSPSRGFTHSIPICCLRFLPFITTTAPTTKAARTIFRSSQP